MEAAGQNYRTAVEVIGKRAAQGDGKAVATLFELANKDDAVQQLTRLAEQHEVPLWVMLIPNLPPERLTKERLGGLVRYVEHFLREPEADGATKFEKGFVVPTLLMSASRLLRVGVSAFGDHEEPFGETDLEDILETIRAAKERCEAWLSTKESDYCDQIPAFDGLDLLTVLQFAMIAGLDSSTTNGKTNSPIRGVMNAAAALLEQVEQKYPGKSDESGAAS